MKKKKVCRLIVIAVCICLMAQCIEAAGPSEVLAEEVQPENDTPKVQNPEDQDSEGKDSKDPDSQDQSADTPKEATQEPGTIQEEEAPEVSSTPDSADLYKDKEKKETQSRAVISNAVSDTSETPETPEKVKSSFDEKKEQILIEFENVEINKSKVSQEPLDGRFYYTGSNIKPKIRVYTIEEVTDESIYNQIPVEERYESNIEGQEVKRYRKVLLLKEKTDYTITYPKTCKALGTYTFTVKAVSSSQECEGSRIVSYEIVEKAHKWSAWKTTVKATALKKGKKQRTCSICGSTETASIAKLKPTIKLNMTVIPLRVKQTTTKFKVSGLATGDYVKSYKSSNKKVFTVNSKGKIAAKKKGTAKLTVTLASGKKATAKVKVQKGIVKTTKLKTNTSKLVLLRKGTYTLRTALTPLTTQQKIAYSSSNKKVATVSSKGVITAKKKGTAKITVKSGSKKMKVTVTVQTPNFPKGDGNKFLQSCQKIAKTIMTDGNWLYYSGPATGSNIKDSFAEARDVSQRQTNCANYVNFCMQDAGTLMPGMSFYSNSNAQIVYRGNAAQKAAVKKMIEENYDIIKVGGKKAIKAGLKPGDICLYKGHTNVYAGLDDKGVPLWYDAGRGSTSDGKQMSGYFTNMYRSAYYNSLPVYTVLRLKK